MQDEKASIHPIVIAAILMTPLDSMLVLAIHDNPDSI